MADQLAVELFQTCELAPLKNSVWANAGWVADRIASAVNAARRLREGVMMCPMPRLTVAK